VPVKLPLKRASLALVVVSLFAAAAASARELKTPVTVTVMSRNLYLGTNLDAIVKARSLEEALTAVAAGWAQVQANDFPTRARAIAREIATVKPDFVGFQEATLYRTQAPPALTRATHVELDYVQELRKALAARKLKYRFAVIGAWTDAQLPAGSPATMDVRLTVRDALLVRTDRKLKIRRVGKAQYAATTPLFGGFVTAKRGYVYAVATKGGRTFRVINTHLESFSDTTQVTQSEELVRVARAVRVPTILLGDLNSRADGSGTPSRANLLAAGFRDAWVDAHPTQVGLTCCHGNDLREAGGPFSSRIDYVLARNGFVGVAAGVLGEAPGDRLNGLWPSDHAGVWARLRLG
jgi:endonuclease/exonuclease/phosphatase family metal-dependent hydrolase